MMAGLMSRAAAAVILVLGIVGLILALLWLQSCQTARVAKTEARLSNGMAGAAIGTAQAADNAVGDVAAERVENLKIVKDTNDALQNSGTAADVNAAGRDGLRRLDKPSR